MRKAGLLFAIVVAAAGVASAQETQPPQNPPPTQQNPPPTAQPTPIAAPPAIAPAADMPAPLSAAELRRRRNAIDAMEGALPTAVRNGAKETMREIEAVSPGMNFITNSAPRARGFHLEGYGVFFYVEIPGVRPSVASLVNQLERERERNRLPDRGSASRAAAETPAVFDPNASYTEAVKRQLIDAMLDWSTPLDLRPYEWLTIAARDGDEPIPTVIYESITMIVRARGSDLADFRAGRITRDEMLKRVEVRGF